MSRSSPWETGFAYDGTAIFLTAQALRIHEGDAGRKDQPKGMGGAVTAQS